MKLEQQADINATQQNESHSDSVEYFNRELLSEHFGKIRN
jgi:hypothetical protein